MLPLAKQLPQFKKPNNTDELAEEFFKWMEVYHSIRTVWDNVHFRRTAAGSESNSYSSFRDIAKRRLVVMIKEFLDSKKS
jgi:hypothetical protein